MWNRSQRPRPPFIWSSIEPRTWSWRANSTETGWTAFPIAQAAATSTARRTTSYYDLDVLHLYDARADGVEDPTSAAFQAEGFVNFHPSNWFEAFVK